MMTVSTERQPLARVRREQQEQRLRRGDENVGRRRAKPRALERRRVAGADRDLGHGDRHALCARATSAMPASGARRLRSTSTASALSGET